MVAKSLKQLSLTCAGISIFMGILYLFLLNFDSRLGISYTGSLAFILTGLGIAAMQIPTKFPWHKCFAALLCTLCLFKLFQIVLYPTSFQGEHFIFLSPAYPLNIVGFGLIGTFLLFWNRKEPTQFQFLYGFFGGISCLAIAVLGLLIDRFHFVDINGIPIPSPLLVLLMTSIGLLSALIRSKRIYQVSLYQWTPFLASSITFAVLLLLSYKVQTQQIILRNLIAIGFPYNFSGGLIFSLFSAFFVYFFFLSIMQFKKLQEAEKMLKIAKEEEYSALKAAEVGTWRWDIIHDRMQPDELVTNLFGLNSDNFNGTFESVLKFVHPADKEEFSKVVDQILKRHEPFDINFRFILPNKLLRVLRIKGNFLKDAPPPFYILTGIIWDITESKYSEQLLHLSEEVAKILGRASTIKEAAALLLHLFHSYFGWEILAIWKRGKDQSFDCLAMETYEPHSFPKFLKFSKTIRTFGPDPFAELLFENREPIALKNLGEELHFKRSRLAARESIRGTLVFPIIENDSVTGIIELFRKDPLKAKKISKKTSDVFKAIGINIGEFIQKKNSEAAKEELVKIVTLSQEPIYSINPEGVVLSWNPAAEKIFGWTGNEIIGRHSQILVPEDRQEEIELLQQAYREGKQEYRLRTKRRKKGGDMLWVDNTYSLLSNEKNETKISVIVHDITEEKKALEALAKSEEKYRLIVESTDDWIWEMDQKGIFTYSNPAVKNILDYTPSDVLGQTIYYFIPDEDKARIRLEIDSCIKLKKGWSHHLHTWKDKHGNNKILESTSLPIYNEQNQLTGFRGVHRDITEQEKAEKTKNEFISMVSHEIKTPLTSIQGALGLLSIQKDLSSKANELIQLAYRNSSLLVHLIQDIIDIEKINLGKFEYHFADVPLVKIIQEAIHSVTLISKREKVQIIQEGLKLDPKVHVDQERIMQVLLNLLSNAINYSQPQGKIFITMELIGKKVKVSVRDEGPGIPEEFQSKIFGRFEQAYSSIARAQKGTGLGLNISKTIIEKMGGSIGFISTPEKGTTFYFELPIVEEL